MSYLTDNGKGEIFHLPEIDNIGTYNTAIIIYMRRYVTFIVLFIDCIIIYNDVLYYYTLLVITNSKVI